MQCLTAEARQTPRTTPLSSSSKRERRTRFNTRGRPSGGRHHLSSSQASISSSCRFIPSRRRGDRDWREHCIRKLFSGPNAEEDEDIESVSDAAGNRGVMKSGGFPGREFNRKLAQVLFDDAKITTGRNGKILQFGENVPLAKRANEPQLRDIYDQNRSLHYSDGLRARRDKRHICATPDRILDSPEIVDDYYLNLLDWSSQNVVAIALGNSVYVWHAPTSTTTLLMRTPSASDPISSLKWSSDGTRLAIGTTSAAVQLWDVEKRSRVRMFNGHRQRVSVLAWQQNPRGLLSSGGRDASIQHHDMRMHASVGSYRLHSQEVCGLAWSPDNSQLASGGNDNLCMVWDAQHGITSSRPRLEMNRHIAAVKALAWCPFQSRLLASGGGTADRHIRFWNTISGKCIGGTDTQSQVCGLVWNTYEKELLSAHGFSKNQLTIWKYPSMSRVADLTGHSSRVLHLAMSPDETTVCSASADETLRFWKVFRASDHKGDAIARGRDGYDRGALKSLNIR